MPATRTLFRPVGLKEGELILNAVSRRFPPRLPEQPIFYPVLNQEYASQIAREWNAPREPHFAGFVTRFEVEVDYVARFEERVVGSSSHRELWVPAEQLDEFNSRIVGRILFVEAHYGEGYRGPEPVSSLLKGKRVDEQLRALAHVLDPSDLERELAADTIVVQFNLAWWRRHSPEKQGLDVGRKESTLDRIAATLKRNSTDAIFLMA